MNSESQSATGTLQRLTAGWLEIARPTWTRQQVSMAADIIVVAQQQSASRGIPLTRSEAASLMRQADRKVSHLRPRGRIRYVDLGSDDLLSEDRLGSTEIELQAQELETEND